ncbi:MAG: SDR family NAD(P)-dependent oxidoreductase [Acidimicrobiales bacterium]
MVDRLVVVSGGGTGIGRAVARRLAGEGDQVLVVGRRAAVVEQAAAQINAEVGAERVRSLAADVSDPKGVAVVAAIVDRELGGVVDGLVNNAGGGALPGSTLDEVASAWQEAFTKNVLSAVLLTTALGPTLRRPGGRVILISSMATRSGGGGGPYVAMKAALNGWVLALTAELAPDGITANVVLPGYTPDTELFGSGLPPAIHDAIVTRVALGRAGTPADVAGVVRFLLSGDASFVTSQLIEVSGGVLPPKI